MKEAILQLQEVSLNFPNSQRPVLNKINLNIHVGDFIVILGNNGSGKTSLFNVIQGMYQSYLQGQILYKEKSLIAYEARQRSQEIYTLNQLQDLSTFKDLTIYENCYLASKRGGTKLPQREDLKKLLAQFNPVLSIDLDKVVVQLSGGERQALALALCFLGSPQLLLLDEHTSALDPKAAENILELTVNQIVSRQITTIMITHCIEDALKYGNRLIVLKKGIVVLDCNHEEKQTLSIEQILDTYN
ncbi:MAG: hypothetical protein K0S74_1157 [Chlamydiales bacterium]|jgi:putative ABC transport system ATP-binding protein|nr:hypothetical protein [Chlamydiales bacterium]